MNQVYFNFVNNGRGRDKSDKAAGQYLIFALLLAANIFMIIYCFNLSFNQAAALKPDDRLNYAANSAVDSATDPAADYAVNFPAAGLNADQSEAVWLTKDELDLSAFDSSSLAAVKNAFVNFDVNYLKRLSADLNELNLKSALSPFLIFKIVEAAFQNYIFINSFTISRTAPLKAAVKIYGFTPSNNYFITFSDYLSRISVIDGFTFEAKENPGSRTRGSVSAPEDKGGINFSVTFDYTVKVNN